MNYLRKTSILAMLLVMSIIFLVPTSTKAATVGQSLPSPESGWNRYDDKNSNFYYIGSEWERFDSTTLNYYDNSIMASSSSTSLNPAKVKFKFVGSKIRLIGVGHSTKSKNVKCVIDGVLYNFSNYADPRVFASVMFEKTNLTYGTHTVEIYSGDTIGINLDAVDIDDSGYLVDYYMPTNLNAVGKDKLVSLSWNTVDGVAKYNIKRSLDPTGSFAIIGTSTTNSFDDVNVDNNVTYYYKISSVLTEIESSNSNQTSAIPVAAPIGNNAILEITMTNGGIKTYDLTFAELDSYLIWYDNRSEGNGKSYYVMTKKNDIKPYLSKKEYIAYDKISSFEVREYTE